MIGGKFLELVICWIRNGITVLILTHIQKWREINHLNGKSLQAYFFRNGCKLMANLLKRFIPLLIKETALFIMIPVFWIKKITQVII